MAGAALKPKAQELAEKINLLSRNRSPSEPVDEWSWRLLMRDAERLEALGNDQSAFATLLKSVLWGLKVDVAQMDACFSKYARLYKKDWLWHRIRSMQGPAVGRLDMVTDMLQFGYPKGSPSDVGMAARVCNQVGLFRTSAKILGELDMIDPGGANGGDRRYFAHFPSTLSYMNEHGVDEADLARRIEVATRVVIQMSGPLSTFSVASGEYGITFEYTVNADVERLVDIDFAISEALADEFDDTLSQHLSIGVIPPSKVR